MSLRDVLDRLEEQIQKEDFKNNVVGDLGSEGEVAAIWYESNYSDADLEDEEFDEYEKTGIYPIEGTEWDEALDVYINTRWCDFEYDFVRIAKVKDNKLYVYRMITVESIPKYIYYLEKGKPTTDFKGKRYKGLGIYWSWDKTKADAHWGYEGKTILLTGLVGINDIEYKNTALKNLNPGLGEAEAEIQVKKGASIEVIEVEDGSGKLLWETKDENIKIAAKLISALRKVTTSKTTTTLTVFRGLQDVWAKNISDERKSEGYWGKGTYYALNTHTGEDYIKRDALASGNMKRWGFVGEFTFTGSVKKLAPDQPTQREREIGCIDLPKKYPKESCFLLLQGDDYNPPEGGEQLLITPKSKSKAVLKQFWVYFVKDKDAKYFSSVCKKKNKDNRFGPFTPREIKKVDACLASLP